MGFDAPLEEINALFETFVNAEGGSNKHTLQLSQLSSLIESYGKANAMALDNDVSLDDTAEPATSKARPGRCSVKIRSAAILVKGVTATNGMTEAAAGVTKRMQVSYKAAASRDLGKGRYWRFLTFTWTPALTGLLQLDNIFRVAFPLAYLIYVLVTLSEVNFGADQYALLRTAPCYVAQQQPGE